MKPAHLIRVFFLLLALTVVLSGVMLWYAREFRYANGESFSILDLQLPSEEATLRCRLAAIAAASLPYLTLQLWVDFLYMAACYPAIAVLSLVAGYRSAGATRQLFHILAVLMVVPWLADIYENIQLLRWLAGGECADDSFVAYWIAVRIKFGLAGLTFVLALAANVIAFAGKLKKN